MTRTAAALLSVAAVLASTVACGGMVQRGERHLEAGRYDRAADLAARAVAEEPTARAHALGGRAAFALDDLEAAWAARADARAVDPGHPATLALGAHLATATGDERLLAEVWVDAWDADQTDVVRAVLADRGLVVAAEALATMWRETPRAADALLDTLAALATDGDERQAVTTALADAADLQLYRLVADRDLEDAEALIATLSPLLGEAFVLRKHRALIEIERTLHPSRGPLLALVDDDVDTLSALAFELRARGVHRSAALAWRIVADRTSGDAAAEAWRQAAESEYRLGFDARAREAHNEAFAATTRPADMAVELYRAAAARGDASALDLFAERLDAVDCAGTDPDVFFEAFDALVEGWILENRGPIALVDRLDARIADPTCPGDPLLLATGVRMANARYEPLVAAALLDRAVAARPNGAATRARIALAERRTDPLAAAEAMRTHVDRTTVDGWPPDGESGPLLAVLATGTSDAVRLVRLDTLRRWHTAAPADLEVTRLLAAEILDAGGTALPIWDAHADASDDPWTARLFAAGWMTARDVDPTTRIDLLERIIAEPSTRRLPLSTPTDVADTVYESALQLLVDAYLETGRDGDVVTALEAWIDARGADDPATWDPVWSRRALLASLGADERARLARRALAAGYTTPDIWHELAIAESGAGRNAAARDAIDGALDAAPERTGELVDRLVERGRIPLALYALDAYADRRGDDAFVLRRTLELHVDELLRARGSSDDLRLRTHRNGVARAVTRVLARGRDLHVIDLELLRIAGLHELAWRVGAERVSDPGADRYASLEVVRDGLSARLPLAMVDPWLRPWRDRLDERDADEIASLAVSAGHVGLALELRLDAYYDVRRPGERVAMLAEVMYPASVALPIDAYRQLVVELVEDPAQSITDPGVVPVSPFEVWADDTARAAELYAAAATLYAMRGLDVDVVRTGQRALDLGVNVGAPTLEAIAQAAVRAVPDDHLRDTLSRAVGATSLGAEAWTRTARVLIDAERWDDAAWALERAQRLLATGDASVWSWSGVVAAHRGDDDDVRAAIDGIAGWGRTMDAELAAGLLRTHLVPALVETGRHDLVDVAIETAAALQPADDEIQIELARRLILRGDLDGARRRVADVVARTRATRLQIQWQARAGFLVEAARLVDRADERNPLDLLPREFDSPSELPAAFARLRGADVWFGHLARSEPASIDAEMLRLHDLLGGLCLAPSSPCGALATTLDPLLDERLYRDDVIDLAAVAVVRGDLVAHARAWDRAAGEAFGMASFDPSIPPAVVLADHAEAGVLDALDPWLAEQSALGVDGAGEARRWLALLESDPVAALGDDGVDEPTLRRAVAAGWWFEAGDAARRIAADDPGDPRVLPGIVALGRLGDADAARALATGWLDATGGLSHPRADVAEALLDGGLLDDGVPHVFALLDTAPDTVAERAALAGLAAALTADAPELAGDVATRWLDRAPTSRSHRQRVATTLMDRGFAPLAARIYGDLAIDLPADASTRESLVTALAASGDDAGATDALRTMRDDGLVTSWALDRLAGRAEPAAVPRLAATVAAMRVQLGDATLDTVAASIAATSSDAEADASAAAWIAATDQHPAATGALIDRLAIVEPDVARRVAAAARDAGTPSIARCDAVWRALATSDTATADTADVIAALDACRVLAPDPNGWQTRMAVAMASAEAWPVAEAIATRVLLEEPDNGVARAVRATARAAEGRIDEAVADLDISQGVDAGWRDQLVQATQVLATAGAGEDAMRVADRLAARVSIRGVVLPGTPRTNRDGIIDAFEALAPAPDVLLAWLESRFADVREHPELTAATTAVTLALEETGRVDESIATWQRAVLSRPESAYVHNNYAWTLAETGGDLDEAERLARRAVSLEREPNANTWDTLGWVLHLQGRHVEARAWMVQALVALDRAPPSTRAAARPVLVEHLEAIDAAIAASAPTDSADPETSRRDRRGRRR